ncbi:MAG: 16S rRNA (cytosine(967)-C(5))-methyltransferase [Chloroflexi bacterium]|nr:16S rRNA (cytosine(967)-C(5))-methyltransferase [Chloroflexota bacterium]
MLDLPRGGQFFEFFFHEMVGLRPKMLACSGASPDSSAMPAPRPREIALRLLRRWESGQTHADTLLAEALPSLPPRERPLCQELFLGAIRRRATLDWLIDLRTNGRRQPALVQSLLRLGLYQIFWLDRVPNHAAVNETVNLARQCDIGRASGFINAVLRNSLREEAETRHQLAGLRETHPAIAHSHPDWLVRRWQARWGDTDASTLLDWNNRPAQTHARRNTLYETSEADWIQFDWAHEQFLTHDGPANTLPGFEDGAFYIQDPSTLLAVELLNPQPDESLLDLCAAPGGKTTAIAARMQNTGHLVASDIREDRLQRLRENCKRLGADCVEVMPAGTDVREKFDGVLLDVPCTNTGVMRRRVDLRWRLQPHDLQATMKTQRELLMQAARNVTPGGRLVYSTCSLEPEENSEMTREFLTRHPAFVMEKERDLLPFRDGVDGAYATVMRLTAT